MNTVVNSAKGRIQGIQQLVEVQLTMWGFDMRDEHGGLTVEGVVLTAMLTIVAAAAGVVLLAKMNSNADAIPDTPSIPGAGTGT